MLECSEFGCRQYKIYAIWSSNVGERTSKWHHWWLLYPTNNLGLNNEVDKNIQYLDVESNTIFTSCSSRENLDRDKIGITQLNMNWDLQFSNCRTELLTSRGQLWKIQSLMAKSLFAEQIPICWVFWIKWGVCLLSWCAWSFEI